MTQPQDHDHNLPPSAAEPAYKDGAIQRSAADQAREKAIAARLAIVPIRHRAAHERAVRGLSSPRQAIRSHCRMCCGWTAGEVDRCTDPGCPLYPYRLGRGRKGGGQ